LATITELGYLVIVECYGRDDDDAGDRSEESTSWDGVGKGVGIRESEVL
jgi:hypothetical protein